MRLPKMLTPLICMLLLAMAIAPAAAEVVWADELTDVQADVRSTLTGQEVEGYGQIDLVSITIAEQGDDVNVTLELAGAWSNDATYTINAIADGVEARVYTFSYAFTVWAIVGWNVVEETPETYVSTDGTKLSWILAKSKISATEKLEVSSASTMQFSGIANYVDDANKDGGGNGGGGNGGGNGNNTTTHAPEHIRVVVEIAPPTSVKITFERYLEGDDASDLRTEFDADLDNQVSQSEVDDYLEFASLEYQSINDQAMQVDGGTMTCSTVVVSFLGLVGTQTDSTRALTVRVSVTTEFDVPDPGRTITYSGAWDVTSIGIDMWDVTGPSSYELKVHGKYKLDITGPQALKDHLTDGDKGIELSGTEMQTLWNGTMGQVTSVKVVSTKTSDGDDSPGFGLLVAAGAVLVAIVVSVRRFDR